MFHVKNLSVGSIQEKENIFSLLLEKWGPGCQVKVVLGNDGRVQGYIRRKGESYRAVPIKGLPSHLSIEKVAPARQMLEESYVIVRGGYVEINSRGCGGMDPLSDSPLRDDGRTLDLTNQSIEEIKKYVNEDFDDNYFAVEKLILSETEVTDEDLSKLSGNNSLKKLHLEKCKNVSTRGISDFLKKNHSIEKLLLTNNQQLCPDALIELFRNGKKLKVIDFEGCDRLRLRETMLIAIAEEMMILREDNSSTIKIYTPSGKNQNISKLDHAEIDKILEIELRYGISDEHVRNEVRHLIKNLATITHFSLLGDETVELGVKTLNAVAQTLEQPECCLEVLDLSKSQIDDAVGLSILAHSLSKNRTLKSLNLSTITMNSIVIEILAHALKGSENQTLEELHLCETYLQDETVEILAKALETNHTLKVLNLSGNRIRGEGAFALGAMIAKNVSIQTLYLPETYCTYDEGITECEQTVARSPSLQVSVIAPNKICFWKRLSLIGNTTILSFGKMGNSMVPQSIGGVLIGAGISCMMHMPMSLPVAAGLVLAGGASLTVGLFGAVYYASKGEKNSAWKALEQSLLVGGAGTIGGVLGSLAWIYLMGVNFSAITAFGASFSMGGLGKMFGGMAGILIPCVVLYYITRKMGHVEPQITWSVRRMVEDFVMNVPNKILFPVLWDSSYSDRENIIKLRTASGGLISASYRKDEEKEYTLLYSHGNATDIGLVRVPAYFIASGIGANPCLYDYPGYGTSEGVPSERGTYEAIEAAYDYLVNEQKVAPDKIILYGQSVGSGPAIELATRKPVHSVILEGAFVSSFRVFTRKQIFPFDLFNNAKKINKMKGFPPVLFVHGEQDEIIAPWHCEELYNKYQGPKEQYWAVGKHHNNVLEDAGAVRAMKKFVKSKVMG